MPQYSAAMLVPADAMTIAIARAVIIVAFFIIVSCGATLHPAGVQIAEAKDAALSLAPLAGALASQVFAFGLFVASVFSATILPVTTAFYICEAFGFEAGIDKTWDEAPQFYALFTAILAVGAGIILIPGAPLIAITLWSQVLNGMFLPVVLVCMILLVNDRRVMGEHVNRRFNNLVGWTTVAVLSALSLLLIAATVLG